MPTPLHRINDATTRSNFYATLDRKRITRIAPSVTGRVQKNRLLPDKQASDSPNQHSCLTAAVCCGNLTLCKSLLVAVSVQPVSESRLSLRVVKRAVPSAVAKSKFLRPTQLLLSPNHLADRLPQRPPQVRRSSPRPKQLTGHKPTRLLADRRSSQPSQPSPRITRTQRHHLKRFNASVTILTCGRSSEGRSMRTLCLRSHGKSSRTTWDC